MADNLFDFLAMRLQQSFVNLNCQNFGLLNDVSTTVDGNGVVVAACFLQQVNAVTAGAGNPTAGTKICPATTASAPPTPSAPATSATPTGGTTAPAAGAATPASGTAVPSSGAATPVAVPTPTGGNTAPAGTAGVADREHHHWWY